MIGSTDRRMPAARQRSEATGGARAAPHGPATRDVMAHLPVQAAADTNGRGRGPRPGGPGAHRVPIPPLPSRRPNASGPMRSSSLVVARSRRHSRRAARLAASS